FLRLLKLPPSVQVALRDGIITMGHARALVALPNIKSQEKYLKLIIDKGLNVRQTEDVVRSATSDNSVKKKVQSIVIPERFIDVPAQLSSKLGTKVNLKRNNNGIGTIVISFKNDEDLDNIISLIKD
ncbi:MAG: chromosome partitioning protein ParB, partial [Bacteroidota bacterium]